jgi:hypothetical protein
MVTGRQPSRQLAFEEPRTLAEKESGISLSEKRRQEWEETLKKNTKREKKGPRKKNQVALCSCVEISQTSFLFSYLHHAW